MIVRVLTSALLVFVLSSCSSLPKSAAGIFGGVEETRRISHFVLWDVGGDIYGAKIPSHEIVLGDEQFLAGNAANALEHYQLAQGEELRGPMVEALALRWAAVYGYQYKFDKGLKLLSEYFKAQGLKASDVRGPSALMLGILYAEKGDTDQGIAWLNACLERGSTSQRFISEAKQSLARVISSATDRELEGYIERWSTAPLVVALAKAELQSRHGDIPVDVVGNVKGDKGAELRIVALLPLSGRYKLLGESTKEGIEIIADRVRVGQPLTITYIDTNNPVVADQELTAAINTGGMDAVLGPVLDESQLISRVRSLDVPMIHFSKNESSEMGGGVFRLGITPSSQVRSLLKAVQSKGLRSIAVVYPNNELGMEIGQTFRQYAQSAGFTIPMSEAVNGGGAALIEVGKRVESSGADGVFYAGKLDDAAQLFSSLSSEFRQGITPIGTALWYNPARLQNLARVMEGACFIVPYYTEDSSGGNQDFLREYLQKYHKSPNFLAAQGGDAMSIVLKGLTDGKSQGVSSISSIATVSELYGLTGKLRVDQSGDIDRSYKVLTYTNGTLQEVS
jgi:branched-chain amino acid transport system substrate-binding protein